MTIGGWILFIIIALAAMLLAVSLGYSVADNSNFGAVIGGLIGMIICILICAIMLWYYNNTESGKRAIKSQESNLNGGIERTVTVYDIEGNVISQYTGKFDVDYNESRIIFDDENGKRHIIYYKTATVIIDEK